MGIEDKERNLKLTQLLSFWSLLSSFSKELNQYQKQLIELYSIESSIRISERAVQTFCKSENLLSDHIETSKKFFKEILTRISDQKKTILIQIEQTSLPIKLFKKNKQINVIFKSIDKNVGHDWVAGWYLFELSNFFKDDNDKISWTQMQFFLKKHKVFNPGIIEKHFTKDTLKERVVRYRRFCKKNGISTRIIFP